MKLAKKLWGVLEDVIGIYLPGVTFIIMFVVFCIQVICRYLFDFQFRWSYELTVIAFMWTTVMGACYASRTKDHVSFDLIYKKFGPRTRAAMDIAGDALVLASLCLLFKPALEYIDFMGIKKTASLGISFRLVYAPIMLFIFFAGLYLALDIARAARSLAQGCDGKEGAE